MTGVVISFLGTTLTSGGALSQVVSNANPLPVTLSGGIGGLAVAGVQPAGAVITENPVVVGGVDPGGVIHNFQVDTATGALLVETVGGGGGTVNQGNPNAGGALAWPILGNVADYTADSGGSVKVGGIYNVAALPGGADGNRMPLQSDPFGNLRVKLAASGSTAIDAYPNTQIGYANNAGTNTFAIANTTLPPVALYGFNGTSWDRVRTNVGNGAAINGIIGSGDLIFNGATWDRAQKPRTAFRLPSSAATNNAANIKNAPGTIYSISGNVTLASSTCYLKLFDTTAVPNPAALTPLYIFTLNIVGGSFSFNLPAGGLYFPTGVGVAIVANPADLDNTAIAAGQITALNVSFA